MSEFESLKFRIEQQPCPICGGKDYEWGVLSHAWYRPGLSMTPSFKLKNIRVRRCLRCDHVDPFVDDKLTRQANKTGIIIFLLMMIPIIGFVLYLLVSRGLL
jgi:hypothetical protein